MRTRRLVTGLVSATVLVSLTAPPAAATAAERHCVVKVVGQRADGELVTTSPRCYATPDAARAAAADLTATDRHDPGDGVGTQSSQLIAIHYDGAYFSGSSFMVYSDSCAGWLNLGSSWNNKISSTAHYCNYVAHYDGFNLTGAWEVLFGSANLLALNNRTSSIAYG